MSEPGRILVLTSCTSLKVAGSDPMPAERMYLGEQHRRLMRGVDRFRRTIGDPQIDLRIVSAGHGLIRGHSPTTPYDESFSGLGRHAIAARAESLGIPEAVADALEHPYVLALLLLGDDYMNAAAIDGKSAMGGPTIAFGGTGLAARLGSHPNVSVVPARKAEASRFHCGLVGLKGELAGRLLGLLAESQELVSTIALWPGTATLDVLDECPAGLAVAA